MNNYFPRHRIPRICPKATLHLAITCIWCTMLGGLAFTPITHAQSKLTYIEQGSKWDKSARKEFYKQDQGSRLIPMLWIEALKLSDGSGFLDDKLSRYGYLPNPDSPKDLPVGFTYARPYLGMNCAACHTRQIQVGGKEYRIDGGPAIVDAQSMLADLDQAVESVLKDNASFSPFAKRVLSQSNGDNPSQGDVSQLKKEVKAWHERYHAQMSKGLPLHSWGPGRMDAVGMIFNRLTGLGIGESPSRIIAENIKRADAPVRYPFLWNAAIQDKTQWPGFADNGSDILGLGRNLGEVYGVFADFNPQKKRLSLLGINYLHQNSANFEGLRKLESLIKLIGPPKYPWSIDKKLAERGKEIFEWPTEQGGCVDCHGIRPGKTRFFNQKTWATPLMDVGTDTREYAVMDWNVQTGVLKGKHIPFITNKLKAEDKAFNVLSLSVLGSIIQYETSILPKELEHLTEKTDKHAQEELLESARAEFKLPDHLQDLKTAHVHPSARVDLKSVPKEFDGQFKYESRVMQGIWAAAPYLHNGSVPTLADLLEPVENRPKAFKIGPNYDIQKLGLAKDQSKFGNQTLVTSTDRNSGNYNGGHEFGTQLSDDDKKALLEYLKLL